ncbi:MBL fold metallo-hydrolase [Candidatus Bathyarchaeota archaeon]|nr:MBL fold metallo-hydrolase [Candidatus Bathyarchaeota archaeon]
MVVKSLKITTLADNLVLRAGLHGQWGLSYLLELVDERGDPRKVIFDTGNDREPLLHNIKKLEVDLSDVDAVVLSHGHGDHTVATVEVVEAAGGCPVYAHPHCFLPRFYEDSKGKRTRGGVLKGQGVEDIKKVGGEVFLSEVPVEVVPGLWTTGQVPRVSGFEEVSPPTDGGRRVVVVDGEDADDQILCDQALWTEVEGVGPWVVTGCAHSGPVNTLIHTRKLGSFGDVYGFIGGTHLVGREKPYIAKTIDALKGFNLKFLSPCHCTGFRAMAMLYNAFPGSFVVNYCGRVFEAGKKPRRMVL